MYYWTIKDAHPSPYYAELEDTTYKNIGISNIDDAKTIRDYD